MARTRTITEEQILNAARDVFLKEGYSASTARIAQCAGVSEGTIFKRFETKQELFLAALRIPHPPAWYQLMDDLVGKGDVKENLVTLAVSILTYFQQTLPQTMVAAGSRVRPASLPPHNMDDLPEPLHVRDQNAIRNFLQSEVDLGRLGPCDVDALAYLILGAFSSPFLIRDFQQKTAEEYQQFAQRLIEALWKGMNSQSRG